MKRILFGGQKGGGGKSTHAKAFSSWLCYEKKEKVAIADLDFPQWSCYNSRANDLKNLEKDEDLQYQVQKHGQKAYPVVNKQLKDAKSLTQLLLKNGIEYAIYDLPGTVNVSDLKWVLTQSDFVFVPLEAEAMAINSNLQYMIYVRDNIIKKKEGNLKNCYGFWNKVLTTASKDLIMDVNDLAEELNLIILPTVVEYSVRYQRPERSSTILPPSSSNATKLYESIYDTIK